MAIGQSGYTTIIVPVSSIYDFFLFSRRTDMYVVVLSIVKSEEDTGQNSLADYAFKKTTRWTEP